MDNQLLKMYNENKQNHPNTILIIIMNDFCQCLQDDAVIITELFNLDLLSKEHYYFTGFDAMYLNEYLSKLKEINWNVIIKNLN